MDEVMTEKVHMLETRVSVLEAGHEVLKRDIGDVKCTVEKTQIAMANGFNDIAKKQDAANEKQDASKKWAISNIITLVLGIAGIIVTILITK